MSNKLANSMMLALGLCIISILPSCTKSGYSTGPASTAQVEPAVSAEPSADDEAPEIEKEPNVNDTAATNDEASELKIATFGAGCFWCVEAVFQEVEGVKSVTSGYCNGHVENPTYQDVCTGLTGHAEVCQIKYDPAKVTFDELLEIFWQTHDPTTLNQQGNDRGTQYRSAVFYHDDEQRKTAEQRKKQLDEANIWPAPIVTEITKAEKFYPAEDYHNNYFKLNPEASYCQFVIQPKVEKFRKVFKEKLKKDSSQ